MNKKKGIKPDLDEGDIVVGRVAIFRVITAEGRIRDDVYYDDNDDGELDHITAISMCALAEHTIYANEVEQA